MSAIVVDSDNNKSEASDVSPSATDPKLAWKLMNRLTSWVKDTIAPAQDYLSLANRYRMFFKSYELLERSSLRPLKPAGEVLREEYAKADQQLLQEACRLEAVEPDQVESVDFVLRALKIVIDKLELRLAQVEKDSSSVEQQPSDRLEELSEPQVSAERIDQALERVKKTALSSARRLLQGELTFLARRVTTSSLLSYLAARHELLPEPLKILYPVIVMFANDMTVSSVVLDYLRGTELRMALSMLNQTKLAACSWRRQKSRKDE